ncbi:MAG: hypothetical protein RLY70_1132 [Planctomycetota bacterium]|jgi:hypothetical protein
MAIDVTCTGCKTRFQVSDKFAGKQGPCPKCKTLIQVPAKSEQVVVHAPEMSGPKDSKGRAVLKPLSRKGTKLTIMGMVLLGFTVLGVSGGAIGLRIAYPPQKVEVRKAQAGRPAVMRDIRQVPLHWLALGAAVLAPGLCWAGYTFLRDDELEPIAGRELWMRIAICSVVYAALWGGYYAAKVSPVMGLKAGQTPAPAMIVIALLPMLLVGGGVGFGSLNLSVTSGAIHYGFYLVVTVLLRLLIGLGPL